MRRLRGCGTALVTPFTRAGAVDVAALEELVRWQLAEGIDFLVPCGSTGEAQTLDEEERSLVVGTVVRTVGGRVPVMAGATHNDTRKAVAEAKRMCGLGVDYILSATPYYNKPTQEGLYRHFAAILDAATRPVCLYNVPGRTAVNLRPDTALRLAQHPNAIGIKEASGDLKQAMDIIAARPDRFAVFSGEDWLSLGIIAAGGDGLISVVSNEVPAATTSMVRHALGAELGEARDLLYRLLPLIDANFIETNPAPVKAALNAMGRVENVLRLPLVPITDSTRKTLLAALRGAGVEPAHV
ncbi:MAG TPA: 4-hydroxy-tetrahydrodipicolinate synthase [Gemmatimonadales bacterium]|jgi:4-hydroxy-tetrahydrodipicolinate synthase|nr:4-hydroxy-tetrahydrodipicolinate synthase [Gemmatimonadales bacterium]